MLYFQNLSSEVMKIKISKGKQTAIEQNYHSLFPDYYFDFICDYREYEADEKGHPMSYLTIPITNLNEMIRKNRS